MCSMHRMIMYIRIHDMYNGRVEVIDNIWDYENDHDVFIIIVMVMLPLCNRDCVIRTMKNSALVACFSLVKCIRN